MKWVIRVVLFIAVVSGLAFMFYRSVQSTRSSPYAVERGHLQNWTLALETAAAPNAPLLVARPPREMASALFRQLFTRLAESFNGPSLPVVPLLLQDEFERSFAGRATPAELLAHAREGAIDGSGFAPRCMGYRRVSAPGVTRQVYFVLFDAPSFMRFRQQLAVRAQPDTGFDPEALSPVMLVGASDADFNHWLPLRANEGADCVAAMVVE